VVVTIDVFPPEYIRYIKLRCTSPLPFELDQIEVRGQGYLRRAVFTSEIIDLGDIANFGRILWAGIEEPGSRLRIYTRNGRDKTVLKYYMINDIGELEELKGETDEENRKKWLALPDDAKGPVVDDTENWTPWSVPYDSSGQVIFSEGPRRYLQLMVVMESDITTNKSSVDSIVIEYSQPVLARRLLGRISPRKGVPLGDSVEFRYKVIPQIDKDKGDTGPIVIKEYCLDFRSNALCGSRKDWYSLSAFWSPPASSFNAINSVPIDKPKPKKLILNCDIISLCKLDKV